MKIMLRNSDVLHTFRGTEHLSVLTEFGNPEFSRPSSAS